MFVYFYLLLYFWIVVFFPLKELNGLFIYKLILKLLPFIVIQIIRLPSSFTFQCICADFSFCDCPICYISRIISNNLENLRLFWHWLIYLFSSFLVIHYYFWIFEKRSFRFTWSISFWFLIPIQTGWLSKVVFILMRLFNKF